MIQHLTVNQSGSSQSFKPMSHRRILCVFPKYAPSFGTFEHAYPLMPGVEAFMPPQGPLTVAAYLPDAWDVRFADENLQPIDDEQLAWADVVLLSGMHVQRRRIEHLNRRAQALGKLTVLGGPSVSGCPSYYPQVDLLHVGELGDATDAIIRRIDQSVERPPRQVIYETDQRVDLKQFPEPAYHLTDLSRYFIGSVQFSSGCPFMCEFCDIPTLYGRNPRIKSPEQIIAELDAMLAGGLRTAVYFVDDNFIANPAAARQLLPHLVEWQEKHGYPLTFACEATLNLAKHDDILEQMRQAYFTTIFCGIETPEPDALQMMRKTQNLRSPIMDAVDTFNAYGMEVVSGIILGLDSDTEKTPDHILEFIERSHIPMLTINLLYALPRTPLYDRLEQDGRLIDDPDRASNVDFHMPYDDVLAMWRRVIREAYHPAALFERFARQSEACYPNRIIPRRRPTWATIRFGLGVIARTLWTVGLRGEHRGRFWRLCGPLLKAGRIDEVMHIGIVSHHLLSFAAQCEGDDHQASFYADPHRREDAAKSSRQPATLGATG